MAVEAGARGALIAPDEKAIAYVFARVADMTEDKYFVLKAAKLANMPLVEFTEYISEQNIPVVDFSEEEFGREMANLDS